MNRFYLLTLIVFPLLFFAPVTYSQNTYAQATPEQMAKRMYGLLTGNLLRQSDPRFEELVELMEFGDYKAAAAIITEDPYFYQNTVIEFAAPISNVGGEVLVPLNDFQATFLGTVRDEIDARELLTGDYLYFAENSETAPSRRNNTHYETLSDNFVLYSEVLVRREPQWPGMEQAAGLLTTRGWAEAHLNMGTNRRPIVKMFENFLCQDSILQWRVGNLPESGVRQDVDRDNGGNPHVFNNDCAYCHASMDPFTPAYSRLDFIDGELVEVAEGVVVPKYFRGIEMYPDGGLVVEDESWENRVAAYQRHLQFQENQTKGKGITALGQSFANSGEFPKCMAEKIFEDVCNRPLSQEEGHIREILGRKFVRSEFNLKDLYQEVAILPACIGE